MKRYVHFPRVEGRASRQAHADLPAGTEITVDYRHLLAPGQEEEFRDALSGERIVGFSWEQSLRESTRALAVLVA